MKPIPNNLIPFKGFSAINLFGVVFVRKGTIITDTLKNHERIHSYQIVEVVTHCSLIVLAVILLFDVSWWWALLGVFSYYILYVLNWLVGVVIKLFKRDYEPYRQILFEKEAYQYENRPNYPVYRKLFAWVR